MENITIDFFASANTGKGFISYYKEIYSDLKHLYIIKGGPGTGKSSLMKKITDKAIKKGMNLECFRCSSDPYSLDGIIIKELAVAIIDGTAPHVMDPLYPGAYDEIIYLGDYWDKKILEDNEHEIKYLCDEKAKQYKLVYSYLTAALDISKVADNIISSTVDHVKIDRFTDRLLKKHNPSEGSKKIRLTEGITTEGKYTLNGYYQNADIVYSIEDSHKISHYIFDSLKEKLNGKQHVVSYSVLDPDKINMIYLPDQKVLFCKDVISNNIIHSKRFVNETQYRFVKKESKNCNLLINELVDLACSHMNIIKNVHTTLEQIYIRSMDFKKKEEYENKLIEELIY